jgi:hypothetical protein
MLRHSNVVLSDYVIDRYIQLSILSSIYSGAIEDTDLVLKTPTLDAARNAYGALLV